MQTIIYSSNTPENNRIIADTIRRYEPKIYILDVPKEWNPAMVDFVRGSMDLGQLNRILINEKIMRADTGLEPILNAVRDVNGIVVGLDSQAAILREIQNDYDQRTELPFGLILDLANYVNAIRLQKTGQQPNYELSQENILNRTFFLEDPKVIIKRFETGIQDLLKSMDGLATKEIKKEAYLVDVLKTKATNLDFLAHLGYSYRTMSHLLSRDGLDIPFEIVGDIFLVPDEKLKMILKYEALKLDPEELRHEQKTRDIDQSKKMDYAYLTPHWFAYYDFYKKRHLETDLIKAFWENSDKIERP